jgi:DNA-formamidopyrimidine glycosylase
MPEGPEVLQISTSLNKLLKNKTLLEINIIENSQYAKKSPNNYDVFIKNLPLKVEYIKCRGKFIYWLFSNGTVMLNHLKMTGFWSVEKKEKHSTLEFIFKEKNLKVYYTDVRRFGRLEFGKNFGDIKTIFDKLGPDVLNDSSFNFKTFKKIAEKKKRTNITRFLMDQENLSGIGNYLKAEILYASKISPHRTVGNLEEKELKTLYENVKKIPKLSYHWKGMSKSDYKDIDGKKGDFERFLKVYCQTKDHLGNKVKSEKTKDGRTTYWVPDVQI